MQRGQACKQIERCVMLAAHNGCNNIGQSIAYKDSINLPLAFESWQVSSLPVQELFCIRVALQSVLAACFWRY